MHPIARGFTLVELLVVISIIVVLLALLAPAMDRAIYQADLAVCGANLRSVGAGAVHYAMSNKRAYFYRPGVADYGAGSSGVGIYQSWRTTILRTNLQHSVPVYDDRPAFRDWLSLKSLQDPMVKKFDIEEPNTDLVYGSYSLFFGWRYQNTWGGQPQDPMYRMGQRFGHYNEFTGDEHRFDILAADEDSITPYGFSNGAMGPHPDKDPSVMSLVTEDNVMDGAWTWAYSQWSAADWHRGRVDMNFTHSDMSVQRINDVIADNDMDIDDPRVARVSDYNQSGNRWCTALPPAD